MIRRPPRSTRTDTLFPYTTRFRSGAGSATDVAARLMTDKLQAKWGQPVIVENKPGADGLLAINAFLQANDDHVLLYSSSASFMAHPYTLRSEEHTSELQSLMRISYAVFCLKKKKKHTETSNR